MLFFVYFRKHGLAMLPHIYRRFFYKPSATKTTYLSYKWTVTKNLLLIVAYHPVIALSSSETPAFLHPALKMTCQCPQPSKPWLIFMNAPWKNSLGQLSSCLFDSNLETELCSIEKNPWKKRIKKIFDMNLTFEDFNSRNKRIMPYGQKAGVAYGLTRYEILDLVLKDKNKDSIVMEFLRGLVTYGLFIILFIFINKL